MSDIEAEARRDERARIVAWLRQEAARYRWLEPTLSPAARALEATAYLIETHAPHTMDLPAAAGARKPARCTEAWTQVSWPHREVRCDRPEGHDGSHSATVVGSTMVPHTEQLKGP